MKKLNVTVHEDEYDGAVNETYTVSVPDNLSEKLMKLIAQGLVFSRDWIPGSVEFTWTVK